MAKNELAKSIGENIVLLRKNLGLSQKELAANLSISYESLSRIENGTSLPSVSRLESIADCLNTPLSALFYCPTRNLQERAYAIAETLEKLPEEQQNAVLKVLYATIEGFESKKD